MRKTSQFILQFPNTFLLEIIDRSIAFCVDQRVSRSLHTHRGGFLHWLLTTSKFKVCRIFTSIDITSRPEDELTVSPESVLMFGKGRHTKRLQAATTLHQLIIILKLELCKACVLPKLCFWEVFLGVEFVL